MPIAHSFLFFAPFPYTVFLMWLCRQCISLVVVFAVVVIVIVVAVVVATGWFRRKAKFIDG